MPLYEYRCAQCGRLTEKIQKFSDAELTVCPHCAGALHRTITAPAVHFSGGGWYKDLYSSAKPPAPGGDSPSGGESKPAGEGSGASPAPSDAGSAASSGSASDAGKPKATASSTAPAPSAPSTPAGGSSSSKG